MRVVILAGRLPRHPWASSASVLHIARALAQRGHDIELICQALDDARALEGVGRVRTFEAFTTGASLFNIHFPRWARTQIARTPHDASLSFTHRLAGTVWCPLDADGASWLAHVRGTKGSLGRVGSVVRHGGAIADAARQRARPVPSGPPVARVVAVGPASARAARETLGASVTQRVIEAGITSRLTVPNDATLADLRSRTRSLLGIALDTPSILVSLMSGHGAHIDPLLHALARAPDQPDQPAPALIALTPEPVRLHTHALRAGGDCADRVRIVGTTQDMLPALAACDAAALCVPVAGTAFSAGAQGRFAADALRVGRPLLALASGSGAELLNSTTSTKNDPASRLAGLIVHESTPMAWSGALARVSDRAWLDSASFAARALGPRLDPKSLVDALENALLETRPNLLSPKTSDR